MNNIDIVMVGGCSDGGDGIGGYILGFGIVGGFVFVFDYLGDLLLLGDGEYVVNYLVKY